jgi:hypothetical protein
MKSYQRTENGVTTTISLAEGLREINNAMMDGKRFVATLAAWCSGAIIRYKDGRKVKLLQIDAPAEPAEWSGTRSRFNHLHRFDLETLRARCNKGIRPVRYRDGHQFRARSEIESSQHADLYTFCPPCAAK